MGLCRQNIISGKGSWQSKRLLNCQTAFEGQFLHRVANSRKLKRRTTSVKFAWGALQDLLACFWRAITSCFVENSSTKTRETRFDFLLSCHRLFTQTYCRLGFWIKRPCLSSWMPVTFQTTSSIKAANYWSVKLCEWLGSWHCMGIEPKVVLFHFLVYIHDSVI